MSGNTFKIKNDTSVAKSIRPYKDRNILLTVAPAETAEIDLSKVDWEVMKNPKAYFRNLGFVEAPKVVVTPDAEPQTAIAAVQQTVEQPQALATASTLPVTPDAVTEPSVSAEFIRVTAESGNVKHFHPGNKLWHVIRNVKDWVIGKVIYNGESYYKVDSLDGDAMLCRLLAKEEALKITGMEAA